MCTSGNYVIIGLVNDFLPINRPVITWTHADLLSTEPLGINLIEISFKLEIFTQEN